MASASRQSARRVREPRVAAQRSSRPGQRGRGRPSASRRSWCRRSRECRRALPPAGRAAGSFASASIMPLFAARRGSPSSQKARSSMPSTAISSRSAAANLASDGDLAGLLVDPVETAIGVEDPGRCLAARQLPSAPAEPRDAFSRAVTARSATSHPLVQITHDRVAACCEPRDRFPPQLDQVAELAAAAVDPGQRPARRARHPYRLLADGQASEAVPGFDQPLVDLAAPRSSRAVTHAVARIGGDLNSVDGLRKLE